MCGLLGVVSRSGAIDESRWRAAQRVQKHRGPDGHGDVRLELAPWTVQLAHQRLAVIDLTEAGRQPMTLPEDAGAGVLVYNGELYNYQELRQELESEGVDFLTRTDSEVLFRALRRWGPAEALRRCNGMWAFAWFDPLHRSLWLSRDRAGEKPLYILREGAVLHFASELKGLLALVHRRLPLDRQSIGEFLTQNLLDAGPGCLLQGVERVPAASLMRVDLAGKDLAFETQKYWFPPQAEQAPDSNVAVQEELRELLLDATRIRLRSDVPVGVLLSGGIDSSAIAAATDKVVGPRGELNLLSMVSGDGRFDESVHIDRASRALARTPQKVQLDLAPNSAFQLLEQAIWHNDAPVGSFSNVAHLLLMRRARELGVTVVLSGQGADELLCGYRKYLGFYLQSLARSQRWAEAGRVSLSFLCQRTVLKQFSFAEGKRYLPSWMQRRGTDIRGDSLRDFKPQQLGLALGSGVRDRQIADLEKFSVPTLTHFEDRMSMAASREIRLPFLDVRIMDLLLSLPTHYKLKSGWTKHVLRKAVEPWLPPEIVWRRDKQGFINPESEWLKHELRSRVEAYFAPDALIFQHRLVDRQVLESKYAEFCRQPARGGGIWFREIFNPLSLEIWLRQFHANVALP